MNGICLRWLRHGVVAALLVAGSSACSDTKAADEPDSPAEQSLDDGPSDREVLSECALEEPCLQGLAQLADQKPFTVTPDRMACIFRALGERKPGRYIHQTDHTFGDGARGAQHVLLVHADGGVSYARATYEDRDSAEPVEKEQPGQRCTLRDASYFVDCLDAVLPLQEGERIAGLAWDCSYGDGAKLDWFEGCEAEAVACE